jgi:hypothetical protein
MAAEDAQTHIILLAKGTMEERMQSSDEIRKLKRALHIAITEGGRAAFDAEIAKWEGHAILQYFIKQLNRHLSVSKAPPRRTIIRDYSRR